MGFFKFEERIQKAPHERTLVADQKIWLYRKKYISSIEDGKPFGMVLKDSVWPDKWVTVECWDHVKHGYWMNTEGRKQEGLPPLPKELLKGRKLKRKKRRKKRAEF